MKFLDIAKKDFLMVYRNKIKLLSVLVVILMPLAYGFIYLWASWDPYSNMKNVSVAIVNEDVGTVYDNKQENFGQQIVDKILEEKVVNWQTVSSTEALNGLDSQKYYAMVLIPQTFSADIASAAGDDPHQAKIQWRTKDSTSYLFTKYFDAVMKELSKKINEQIAGNFGVEAEKQVSDLTSKLNEASGGAGTLASGLGTLQDGSQSLSTNLYKAYDGANSLNNGLEELNIKSYDLSSGISSAKEGAASLRTGLQTANSGASSLSSGLATLQNGSTQLKNGTYQAYIGANQLSNGTSQMNSQLQTVNQELQPLYPSIEQAGQIINALNNSSTTPIDIPNYITDAKNKKDQLLNGQQQIANGANTLAVSMGALDSGVSSLTTGITSAKQGADTLSNGVNHLYIGSGDLYNGLDKLYSGSQQFSQGVGQAYNGSSDLTSGLSQLADGGQQLYTGIGEAKNGAKTLSSKLSDGTAEIKNKLSKDKLDKLVTVINESVVVSNASVDTNQTYGSALAPYFISLALWMGALMLALLMPTRDTQLIINNVARQKITWQKTILPTVVGLAQTAALLFAVIVGLQLQVKYLVPFILFCLLTSFCFISTMQFISYRLDKIGELVGIILMLIQLTSSSGTFPVQSTPRIFQILNPLMPMNYTIKGMRLLILGGSTTIIIKQALVLAGMTITFILLKLLRTKNTVSASELYPLIEL